MLINPDLAGIIVRGQIVQSRLALSPDRKSAGSQVAVPLDRDLDPPVRKSPGMLPRL
jgi:hypothetical protein